MTKRKRLRDIVDDLRRLDVKWPEDPLDFLDKLNAEEDAPTNAPPPPVPIRY